MGKGQLNTRTYWRCIREMLKVDNFVDSCVLPPTGSLPLRRPRKSNDLFFFFFQVRYTGYRDRPQEERQVRFQNGCREGHTEIVSIQ